MKIRKIAALYSIFMGMTMIGMWCIFYITDKIPEIYTKPIEIGLHITAEIVTAIALIIGGIGLLTNQKWSFHTYLISMGMLLYTSIMSSGYFAQQGEFVFVGMFAIFMIITLSFIVLSFIKKHEFKPVLK